MKWCPTLMPTPCPAHARQLLHVRFNSNLLLLVKSSVISINTIQLLDAFKVGSLSALGGIPETSCLFISRQGKYKAILPRGDSFTFTW